MVLGEVENWLREEESHRFGVRSVMSRNSANQVPCVMLSGSFLPKNGKTSYRKSNLCNEVSFNVVNNL